MDLETIPGATDWEPPEDNPDKFPPAPACQIVSNAGMLIEISNKQNRCVGIGTCGEQDDEKSKVVKFLNIISKYDAVVVTFNGRHFDIPVILYRCMHYGIQIPRFFDYDFTYRYKYNDHIDIADKLRDHGAAPYFSLDQIAQVIGLPGKFGVDGKQVKNMIEEGRHDDVDSYCMCDVIQTAYLFIRLLQLKDDISTIVHNNLIHSIKSNALSLENKMINQLIDKIDFSVLEIPIERSDRDYHDATETEGNEPSNKELQAQEPEVNEPIEEELKGAEEIEEPEEQEEPQQSQEQEELFDPDLPF
jgi:predicted PolB exonuclease-like 3'-5' exonuclease